MRQPLKKHLRLAIVAPAVALLVTARPALAVSGFSFEAGLASPEVRWIESLPAGVDRRLRLHVTHDRSVPFENLLVGNLRESGLHPFIEARSTPRRLGLTRSSGQTGLAVEFWLGGIRIHGFGIKAVPLPAGDRSIAIAGNLPVLDEGSATVSLTNLADWPRRDDAFAIAQDSLQPGNGGLADPVAKSAEPVFFATPDGLRPAWRFVIEVDGLPWDAISDTRELLEFSPRFFDMVQTSARVYATNKAQGTLEDIPFAIADGTTHLENQYLKTDLKYGSESRATISDGKFDVATNSNQFRETNVFAHASRHVDYLIGHGYQWDSGNAITLRVAACYDGTCNCTPGRSCSAKSNAIYTPEDSSYGGPSIRIGEGDGVILQDLHFDSDVVSHEFGHHVVVASVTAYSKNTEALQLHEGLADFLVMMRTGSPCLGAGICPSGSNSLCYTAQCLRTADNELTYGSTEFLAGADHQKGQLISGLLWDIKEQGVSASDLLRIVLGAIDLLPANATFGDFTDALVSSDRTLFASANASTIEQRVIARNLDDAESSASNPGSGSAEPVQRKSSGGFFGCTVLAANPRETFDGTPKNIFPESGGAADGPVQMGIYGHEPAGIQPDEGANRGFDIFLALLLALPLAIAIRRVRRLFLRRHAP